MTFKVFTLSLSLFISTGCATLTSGMWDKIRLETTPSGAKVTDESGVLLTTTPGYITIKRKKTPKLTFSKEGYEDVNVQLTRKTNKKSVLNLVWIALGVAAEAAATQPDPPSSSGGSAILFLQRTVVFLMQSICFQEQSGTTMRAFALK
jgi:hypothetical protein